MIKTGIILALAFLAIASAKPQYGLPSDDFAASPYAGYGGSGGSGGYRPGSSGGYGSGYGYPGYPSIQGYPGYGNQLVSSGYLGYPGSGGSFPPVGYYPGK